MKRWALFLLLLPGACRETLPTLVPLGNKVDRALAATPAPPDLLGGARDPRLAALARTAFAAPDRKAGRAEIAKAWPGVAGVLADLLAADDVAGKTKEAILVWLQKREGPAVAALCRHALECRPDQHPLPRVWAAWLLGEKGGPQYVPSLVLRLKYEQPASNQNADPRALAWAARSLALHGNLAGVEILLGMLDNPEHKSTAGSYLIEIIQWQGLTWKVGNSWTALKEKAQVLVERWRRTGKAVDAPESTPPLQTRELLVRLSRCREFNLRYSDDAKYILQRSGAAALDALRIGLGDMDRRIRKAALESVSVLGSVARPLGPELAGLLRDPILGIYAIHGLGHVGWRPAATHLLLICRGDNPDRRQAALLALGRMGAEEALPELERALADTGRAPEEHMAAALALGLLGRIDRARTLLQALRKRPDVHVPTLDEYREELRLHEGRRQTR